MNQYPICPNCGEKMNGWNSASRTLACNRCAGLLCEATTKSGRLCRNLKLPGLDVCDTHLELAYEQGRPCHAGGCPKWVYDEKQFFCVEHLKQGYGLFTLAVVAVMRTTKARAT